MDKMGLNNELLFRQDMLNMNRELKDFKDGVNQSHLNMLQIYNLHKQIQDQIEHNRNKIMSMKVAIREMEADEVELEKERRKRDLLMEELHAEKMDLQREEDMVQATRFENGVKEDLIGLGEDRDKVKGFVQYMVNMDARFSKRSLTLRGGLFGGRRTRQEAQRTENGEN
jgi:hypothetical protein